MLDYLIYTGLAIGVVFLLLLLTNLIGSIYWSNKVLKEKWVTLKIIPNKLNERNPHVADNIFSALHGVYEYFSVWEKLTGRKQPRFSCEIANIEGRINFYIRTPKSCYNLIEGQFYAQYPEAEILEIEDYTAKIPQDYYFAELQFNNTDFYPIKRYSQFEDRIASTINDPIAGITLPFGKLLQGEKMAMQIVVQPINSDRFRKRATKCLRILNKGHYKSFDKLKDIFEKRFVQMGFWRRFRASFWLLLFWLLRKGSSGESLDKFIKERDAEMSRGHERETDISAATDKISRLAFNTCVRIVAPSPAKIKEVSSAFKQFSLSQLNGFKLKSISKGKLGTIHFKRAYLEGQMIMNSEELATVFHLPNETVNTPNIEWVVSKKLEPPQNLPTEENLTFLGKTNFRGNPRVFGIREDDRRRHVYIVGKTGMGKSTLLENMVFSDIQSGKGLAVIDPHGDLAEAILDFVPKSRTNDVIIFNPSDTDYPVAFNMLECKNPEHKNLIASGVVGVFKKIFAESWGPRLEHILRNTVLALVEAPNTTMLGIMRMLVDEDYRKQVLGSVTDPMVLSFWHDEFGKWRPQQVTEAISPIQNKVGQFLSSPLIRNILGQPKSTIDLRFAMDKGKIIVVNLSKGKIGEDNSALLGSMLITKFQLDVMSRADTAEKNRRDFYLYVDEFQNFATDSFATILSEARKYRLNLCVANQYLAQMSDEVREAVFGNVGTMMTFQVGFDDAETLSKQFAEEILPADIGSLPKYQIYLRLMIDGLTSQTFSAGTLPPPEFEQDESIKENIIKVARDRYSKTRDFVEDKIHNWSKNKNNL